MKDVNIKDKYKLNDGEYLVKTTPKGKLHAVVVITGTDEPYNVAIYCTIKEFKAYEKDIIDGVAYVDYDELCGNCLP